jgi:signal transduction histidine kinase
MDSRQQGRKYFFLDIKLFSEGHAVPTTTVIFDAYGHLGSIQRSDSRWTEMPESQPEIERLAPSTQTKLRSTQILTSLPQIVSELIQNSLDANPSQIHVGLDCKEWTCWVQDDGFGISKEDLESLGQGEDGGRYSKSGYVFNLLETC